MGQHCTICRHTERDQIDRQLVTASASNRRIAAQFGTSEQAIRRHKSEHLPNLMVLAHQEDEATREMDLAVLLRRLMGDAHRLREKAEKVGDYGTALRGIRELTNLIELAVSVGEAQPAAEQQRVVRVIWHMGDDELTPSEQAATVPTHPPWPSAPSVPAPNFTTSRENGQLDNNARAESQSKQRARRRRFYG